MKNWANFVEYSERPIVIGFENGFGFPPPSSFPLEIQLPLSPGRLSHGNDEHKDKDKSNDK